MDVTLSRKYESARQLARQDEILSCARTILQSKGYAGLTMRSLAKNAQVAPATLYNLYGSKDDLIVAAVEDLFIKLAARAEDLGEQGIPAVLQLNKLSAQQIKATPNVTEAMARALFGSKPSDTPLEALFAPGYGFIRKQLAYAKSKGDILPQTDTDVIAKHLVGQGWGMVLLWMMGMFTIEASYEERMRSQLMTLVSVSRGRMKEELEAELDAIGWKDSD